MSFDALGPPILGGALIGLASALLLWSHGRIAGISGILGAVVTPGTPDRRWRLGFLFGLVAAGAVISQVSPSAIGKSPTPTLGIIAAGLLVGLGTRFGSGCTSGHGICGMARLSTRSIIAVLTFVGAGALTATLRGVM